MSDTVRIDVTDRIATLTLNRPRKLNALNYETIDRLMELLDAIEVSADVQAVIITGAGPRAFSAGGDIHEFSQSVKLGADTAVRDFVRRGQAMTARLEAFRKALEAEGTEFNAFRDQIRTEVTLSRLRERDVDNKVVVTDAEIDNYLANPTKDRKSTRLNSSHIPLSRMPSSA